jgi:Spy/CpxP family protein refolding chaperone
MLRTLLSVVLLTFSAGLLAQAPADAPKPRGERRFDCSKAKDPKACEERLAKAKAAHQKARQACDGKKGDEGRDCMRREMCAQTKDPAKCEAQVKERAAQRSKIREACKDKKGDELRSCIREQRQKR